jgi:hypothetical protein|tara:strand:+ start:894 stop:1703 length:810 start_codon:yes stop_codon:yes gene_type:complete
VKRAGLIDPDENWKSKDPRELAKEIATFMGGEWPEREPRKIQISLEEAPTSDEELFELTQLNPTLIWEMTQRTRHLFLEVSHAPPNQQTRADTRTHLWLEQRKAYSVIPSRITRDSSLTILTTNPLTHSYHHLDRWNTRQNSSRALTLQVYLEDIQDVYSEVMSSLVSPNLVTYDTLRKFKHLAVSLSFEAVAEVCQGAFDKTDFDPFPEVAPDERPGCMCPLDLEEFTKLTAASTALVKMIYDAEGDLPPAAESRIIKVSKKWHYEDI